MEYDWENMSTLLWYAMIFGLNDLWSGNEISEFIP
jgi:hypothetical protein